MVNFALIVPSFLLAIYYPQVGDIAGLAGSFATMFCIYLLPVGCWIKMKWDEIYAPSKALVENDDLNGVAKNEFLDKVGTNETEEGSDSVLLTHEEITKRK